MDDWVIGAIVLGGAAILLTDNPLSKSASLVVNGPVEDAANLWTLIWDNPLNLLNPEHFAQFDDYFSGVFH